MAVNANSASGAWENPAIWSLGRIPGMGDTVLIQGGTEVTFNTIMNEDQTILRRITFEKSPTPAFRARFIYVGPCRMLCALGGGTYGSTLPNSVAEVIIDETAGPVVECHLWDHITLARHISTTLIAFQNFQPFDEFGHPL